MKNFEYEAPRSVDEVVELLSSRRNGARILAGGTDILVHLREGRCEADLVVDVKKIPELMELAFTPENGLRLGAAVPCYRIHREPRVSESFPALADACRLIGAWPIQSRASVGGNLCNSSPAADTIPALIACQAACHIAGPEGGRTVPAAEFCTAPGENVLRHGELLVSLEFPSPLPRSSSHYLRFIHRNEMDIAVAGCGAWVQLDRSGSTIDMTRIALAAVAPTPVEASDASQWLAGKEATEETLREAGELAKRAASPITDLRGTAEYRMHLVGVLTRRALATAVARARENLKAN